MRIAISMRVVSTAAYHETRDAISHDWQEWFRRKDLKFFPVPNIHPDAGAYLKDVGANAVILSGGNDLVPREGDEGDVSEARNKCESALLSAGVSSGLPVLATCRGLHVVNDHFGGGLTPDLGGADRPVNHVANDHAIRLLPPFSKIAGREDVEVNSYHNQGVHISQLSKELHAFAISPADEMVEGFVHPSNPILAVQWHPERDGPSHALDDHLIDLLFAKGAFWNEP